jgi:hypothetical protein
MKIAIQGHPTRGNEVIEILESLGGENRYDQSGSNEKFVYYINSIGFIFPVTQLMCSSERKIYTLEEFEKEFPFKIGDEVIFPVKVGWLSGKVTGLTYVEDQLKYEVDTRIGGYRYVEPRILQLYPMKEERNITLTLDKAKEWYKKGGELREIALQAFKESELNPLPRSWEEYISKVPLLKVSIDIMPISSLPKKYIALYKLEQLRDCWIQGWKPIWDNSYKWCIRLDRNELAIGTVTASSRFLTFPTKEMAEEFLKCFKDLIEQAGDLI